ncbi:MAG TPA: nitroreductase [Steroidobacteraceae bacterium]|nr:nitroreductase [Steroidobacteraceae bacterium]
MDVYDAINTRRAVRTFEKARVDRATLRKLIDAAIQAPSAVNTQPWCFTIIEDLALLTRISNEAKRLVLENPPQGLPSGRFHELLSDPKFDIFYGAPALILVSSVTADHWAVVNCSLAAQNLMLAARAEGLGTCWIGFAESWFGSEMGKHALGLPTSHLPVAPIIVGRPSSPPVPVPRREPIIRWVPDNGSE